MSVPPETAADFEQIAKDEGRNRSELFREMLRVYRISREVTEFESLQRYGAARSRELGIRDEDDVERLIAGFTSVGEPFTTFTEDAGAGATPTA